MIEPNSPEEGVYFLDRRLPPRLAVIKMVSTVRAQYFAGAFPKEKIYDDQELGHRIISLDLGHLFWRQKLDVRHLQQIVDTADADRIGIAGALDQRGLTDAAQALDIFGSVPSRMPGADELLFSYRVVQRLIEIANRGEVGLEIHQARGILAADFDQFDLATVLDQAQAPLDSALGRQLFELLETSLPRSLDVAILNIRNDAEVAQAVLVAALLKARTPGIRIILEAAGGNEQFDFNALSAPFRTHAPRIGAFIDYYLPKQDFRATLRPLLDLLSRGDAPVEKHYANIVALADPGYGQTALEIEDVDAAFRRHIRHSMPFYSAGRKSLLARLSPARCHWSACSFCTINSQHLVPSGTIAFDEATAAHVDHLIDVLRTREIESLILTDEAIHPVVLGAFAERLLDAGMGLIYRARSRFTDDLTPTLCETLAESGCRYLGMGLESATPRVNALVNKHHGLAPDYTAILSRLEAAGVRPHIYSIMGFPTETSEEIRSTRDFLLRAIEDYDYVTVSANTFYLMRGSTMAKQPKRFGIEQVHARGDLRLVLDFDEPERQTHLNDAQQAASEIYRAEFLPFGDDADFAEGFWHFIDQAGVFYVQKVEQRVNPYRRLGADYDAVAQHAESHIQSPPDNRWLFELPLTPTDGLVTLCDWITLNYVQLPAHWASIALDRSQPIDVGLAQLPKSEQAEARRCFIDLFRTGLFHPNQVADASSAIRVAVTEPA